MGARVSEAASANGERGPDERALSVGAIDVLFREGRTAYDFTDEPVPDATLLEIYDRVRHAPTAMNSQPLRVAFVRTPEAKERLLPTLAEGNRAKSASAPVVAILAADVDFHENLPYLLPMSPDARARFGDDVARERTARFNASLQAGYFILAVRSVGLDAGPMGGFDAAAVDAEFFAGTSWRSFLVVNIGMVSPTGSFPRKPHVPVEQAVTLL